MSLLSGDSLVGEASSGATFGDKCDNYCIVTRGVASSFSHMGPKGKALYVAIGCLTFFFGFEKLFERNKRRSLLFHRLFKFHFCIYLY